MTNGTSQGLFIVVAIVIFGIFVGLSQTLFGKQLTNDLVNLFEQATEQATFDKNKDYNVEDVIPSDESDFEFDGVNKITGYKGTSTEVVIPNEIDNKKVTSISGDAFNNKGITKLIMPNSLTTIEDGSIVIEPQEVASTYNFRVSAEDSNRKVVGAFANNTIEEISFSANLKYIGSFAFFSGELEDVILPEGLKSIGEGSFEQENLKDITIPSTVENIGNNAFKDNNIKEVNYAKGSLLKVIGDNVFSGNDIDKIELPSNIEHISDNAYNNAGLESVVIPKGTKSIGENAFSDNDLKTVVIPSGVKVIGKDAFSNNNLTDVTIPETVVTIDEGAFKENELTNVNLPEGLESIGSYAFYKNKLPVINLPNSLLNIGTYAFGYNELKGISVPSKLSVLEDFVFSFNKMTVKPNIPTNIVTEKETAFYGNLFTEKVVFKDSKLASLLATQLGIKVGDITQSDILSITKLNLSGQGITSLSGLEYAINLVEIDASKNKITDITPISKLMSLKKLNLYDNVITSSSLRNLSYLTNLTDLDISFNGLSDSDVGYLNTLPIINKNTIQKYVVPNTSDYLNGLTDSDDVILKGTNSIMQKFLDNNLTTGHLFDIYYANPSQTFIIELSKPHDIYRIYTDDSSSRYGNMGSVTLLNSNNVALKSFNDSALKGYINVDVKGVKYIKITARGGDGSWRLNEFDVFGNPSL